MSVAHALGSQKPLGRHSLALLIGLQLLLAFLSYDIASVPKHALSARLQVCLQEPPQ